MKSAEREQMRRNLLEQWGNNLRSAREAHLVIGRDGIARSMTQAQLADDVGVTQQAVAKWEGGEAAPDALHQYLIAKALGVKQPHLLFPIPREVARS